MGAYSTSIFIWTLSPLLSNTTWSTWFVFSHSHSSATLAMIAQQSMGLTKQGFTSQINDTAPYCSMHAMPRLCSHLEQLQHIWWWYQQIWGVQTSKGSMTNTWNSCSMPTSMDDLSDLYIEYHVKTSVNFCKSHQKLTHNEYHITTLLPPARYTKTWLAL